MLRPDDDYETYEEQKGEHEEELEVEEVAINIELMAVTRRAFNT